MVRCFLTLSLSLIMFFSAFDVSAQEEVEISSEHQAAREQSQALNSRVGTILQRLAAPEAQHFLTVYANYAIVSTVKAVRDDVANAVGQCGENNPQMKRDLDSRYEQWRTTVETGLKEADANINNLIIAQGYIPVSEMKAIFSEVDAVRSVNSSRFEKTPVTSSEACEFMMSKMNETEQNMTHMLSITLKSFSNLLQKTQQ